LGAGPIKPSGAQPRYADGWTQGGMGPDAFKESLAKVRETWQAEGRDGSPRTMALFYFALGDRADEDARRSLGHYYAFLGDYAEQVVEGAAKDKDTLQSYLSAFEAAGADEGRLTLSPPVIRWLHNEAKGEFRETEVVWNRRRCGHLWRSGPDRHRGRGRGRQGEDEGHHQ
jgi:alkanesulfonate monooxygenase SsuD/methylene tetrahydromethanopterin reductase-like flavin-dependent oxidoreductase (luciferase family)